MVIAEAVVYLANGSFVTYMLTNQHITKPEILCMDDKYTYL